MGRTAIGDERQKGDQRETNGGPFGTGNLDFSRVLQTLAEVGYSHFASVKIYHKVDWEEAARGAISFLRENANLVSAFEWR